LWNIDTVTETLPKKPLWAKTSQEGSFLVTSQS